MTGLTFLKIGLERNTCGSEYCVASVEVTFRSAETLAALDYFISAVVALELVVDEIVLNNHPVDVFAFPVVDWKSVVLKEQDVHLGDWGCEDEISRHQVRRLLHWFTLVIEIPLQLVYPVRFRVLSVNDVFFGELT